MSVRSLRRVAVLSTATVTLTLAAAVSTADSASADAFGTMRTCAAARAGEASCLAELVTRGGHPMSARVGGKAVPFGYGPADIRAAYRLSANAGQGRVVATVDAYDAPSAERDLAVYRRTYGLPPCTTANGCFRKVDQRGGHRLPRKDAGWALETSLDLDMISATCPKCRILLVETDSPAMTDLAAGVDYAATQHVAAISNSYGSNDMPALPAYDHPGIAITAAAGDNGYRVEAPASFSSVIAVGGTSLTRARNARGWKETAWQHTGSGCSRINPKPAWQTATTHCQGKTTADVSAVADPRTGVAAYDSTPVNGFHGWGIFGGTSAASPIVAAVYAMAKPLTGTFAKYPASWTWTHRAGLNDVTAGANGRCATRALCAAGAGWDGPTGLGTPKGTASF